MNTLAADMASLRAREEVREDSEEYGEDSLTMSDSTVNNGKPTMNYARYATIVVILFCILASSTFNMDATLEGDILSDFESEKVYC